jgi:O-antigen/teichoic acid export membrane protein
MNVAGLQVPVMLLSHFFNSSTVGYYSMAIRILGLPSTIVGQAVAQVFYPMAAKMQDSDSLRGLAERLATTLLAIGIPVFGMVAAAGPQLFSVVFGHHWEIAGSYAQVLAPWFMMVLVSSPLSMISLVKERQGLSLVISVYEMVLRIVAVLLGGLVFRSPSWTVALLSLSGVIICVLSVVWMLGLVGVRAPKLLWSSLKRGWVALSGIGLVWCVSRIAPPTLTLISAITVGSLLLYRLRSDLASMLKSP